MKTLIQTLLLLAAAGVGLLVGLALRGKSDGSGHATHSPAANSPGADSNAQRHRASSSVTTQPGDVSPLATKLERDLALSTGVTQWLHWMEALEKAAPQDFPRLVLLAQGNATATRLLAERWANVAPRHLFDTLVAAFEAGQSEPFKEIASVLFQEWPKRDAGAVVAALSENSAVGPIRIWRLSVAGAIIEKDVELGLRLFSRWDIGNYGPRMTAVAKWAAENPRHAAEFALEHPAGHASQMALETIGVEWARTDPRSALEFALGKPGELSSILANAALKQWATSHLADAAEWLAGSDARTRNRLSPSFVEAWGKEDASKALGWCEENLTGSVLARAAGGVLKGAAETDLMAAAQLVANLQPSPARSEAATAVAAKMFPDLSSEKGLKPEMILWLKSLDPESIRSVLDQVTWKWATSDPMSMATFLAGLSREAMPPHAWNVLAREMARRNPVEAMEWAGGLPEDRRLSAGGDAFSEWRRSQPAAAMTWLNALPEKDPRRLPYLREAIRTLAWEHPSASQFAGMTPDERSVARDVIKNMSLPEDRRARLLGLLRRE